MDLLFYDPWPPRSIVPARPRPECPLFHPPQGVVGWLAAIRRWVEHQAR